MIIKIVCNKAKSSPQNILRLKGLFRDCGDDAVGEVLAVGDKDMSSDPHIQMEL